MKHLTRPRPKLSAGCQDEKLILKSILEKILPSRKISQRASGRLKVNSLMLIDFGKSKEKYKMYCKKAKKSAQNSQDLPGCPDSKSSQYFQQINLKQHLLLYNPKTRKRVQSTLKKLIHKTYSKVSKTILAVELSRPHSLTQTYKLKLSHQNAMAMKPKISLKKIKTFLIKTRTLCEKNSQINLLATKFDFLSLLQAL